MNLFPKKPAFFPSDATLAEKIMECVRCDIQENDNLPQKICIKCILDAETAFQFKRTCEQSLLILNTKVKQEKVYELDETIVLEANEKEETFTAHKTSESGSSDMILCDEPEKSQKTEQKNELEGERPEMTLTKEEYLLQMCLSNNKIPVKAAEKPDNTRRSQRLKIKKIKKQHMGQTAISNVKTTIKTMAKASVKRFKLASQVRQNLLSYIQESAAKQRVLRKQKNQI